MSVTLGNFALTTSPVGEMVRYTIVHVPTAYVKMDQAMPATDDADLLRSVVEMTASQADPRTNKAIKAFPAMVAREAQVWDDAKAATAS